MLAHSSKASDLDERSTLARAYFMEGRSSELHLVEAPPLHLLGFGAVLAVVAALFVRSGIRGRSSRTLRIEGHRIVMRHGLFGRRTESLAVEQSDFNRRRGGPSPIHGSRAARSTRVAVASSSVRATVVSL